MFGFIKKIYLIRLMVLSSLVSTTLLLRPEIINVNNNEPVFYSFSIKTSKCSGSCNNINDPYAKMCVPNVVIIGKGGMKINIDVFAKN